MTGWLNKTFSLTKSPDLVHHVLPPCLDHWIVPFTSETCGKDSRPEAPGSGLNSGESEKYADSDLQRADLLQITDDLIGIIVRSTRKSFVPEYSIF